MALQNEVIEYEPETFSERRKWTPHQATTTAIALAGNILWTGLFISALFFSYSCSSKLGEVKAWEYHVAGPQRTGTCLATFPDAHDGRVNCMLHVQVSHSASSVVDRIF